MTTTLLYDQDCGFCRWATDRILRWDRGGAVRALPIQSEEGDGLLASIDPAARLASAHVVEPGGRVRSGGALVEPLLRCLPGGRPLAALAHLAPRTTDTLYRVVARNRTTFGRWLEAEACRVDPAGASRKPA